MRTAISRHRVITALTGLVLVSTLGAGGTTGLAGPSALQAQTPRQIPTPEEDQLLREARVLEAQGDHRGAEERLRLILERNPGHAGALLTLHRILGAQGRWGEALPLIREHLDARPRSPAVRALQLRLLALTGSAEAFRDAVDEWAEQDPRSLEPYREAVGYHQELFGPERTLDFIDEARDRTGVESALAIEAGDMLARLGRGEEAVAEWGRAFEGGASLTAIVQRIRDLPGDARGPIQGFVDSLEQEDAPPEELRAAARLALDAGLEESAIRLASRGLEDLDSRGFRGFLLQFASRAEGVGALDAALWAYQTVRDRSELDRERRTLDDQIAELALAAGDTTRALEAWERVNESLPAGSVERRRSVARAVAVEIQTLSPGDAADRVEEFRGEFPGAPELDHLTARVAERLMEAGREGRAAEILAGIQGPRSSLERAYLQLRSGEVQGALPDLEAAVRSLSPSQATEILQLVTFLQGAEEGAAELGGRVAALVHEGRVDDALSTLEEGVGRVSLDDRPGLLALGARLVENEGRPGEAARLRARLVERFPEAAETPEAQLRLARHRADEGRQEEARALLEDLILNRPESAVVPEAR
ncbi:MAG: tetratricopeptide repeat protein, partial [Longimicrobiales bacterium]|nr:tetratricopeptide repeat protein [Longimicrobiales bacterium]